MVKIGVLENKSTVIWLLVVFREIFLNASVFAAEENSLSRSAYFITRENKRLPGHVVKRFESPSLMSCSQSCLRNSWCTSTNFKGSFKKHDKGTCELNKHEIAPINKDTKLIDQPGVTFSMFLKGCLMTGCLNGGSCLFDKKMDTFSCSCKLLWSGDKCDVRSLDHECEQLALGMESGAISNAQISASSQNDDNHAAVQGRLHFKETSTKAGAWSALTADASQWLQVDLGNQDTKVTRVATQGRNYRGNWPLGSHSQWVISYKLQYSDDGVNFQYYKEQGQSVYKAFAGNTDRDTVVYHELDPPIRAQYIRVRPAIWRGQISMRVELYGC